ncbi:hypothetical protein SUS17_903 [Sphingomonas sp. S17]|nr:hypothetical protein SUS17_903 [Sphingomonas sp. S17]
MWAIKPAPIRFVQSAGAVSSGPSIRQASQEGLPVIGCGGISDADVVPG